MNFITSEPRLALGVRRSILDQPWHWRGLPADDLDASFSPDDLVEIAAGLGFTVDPHDNVEDALAATSGGARVLIFGSLYLAGAVLAANDQAPD